jgi:hypothetical protein
MQEGQKIKVKNILDCTHAYAAVLPFVPDFVPGALASFSYCKKATHLVIIMRESKSRKAG